MTGSALMTAKIMAYDTSYSSSYEMSTFHTYERTYEICNEHTVCMYSGNVIKFNSYTLKEPFIVNNHDMEFGKTLEQMRLENSVIYEQDDSYDDISDPDTNLSEDEAAARLLTDAEYSYDETSEESPADSEFISDDSGVVMDDEY